MIYDFILSNYFNIQHYQKSYLWKTAQTLEEDRRKFYGVSSGFTLFVEFPF